MAWWMEFTWHPPKAASNKVDHGLSFETACKVWDDPLFGLVKDRVENGEQRWHAIGVVGPQTLLVVHTYPDPEDEDKVHLISARKASPHERKRYEQSNLE